MSQGWDLVALLGMAVLEWKGGPGQDTWSIQKAVVGVKESQVTVVGGTLLVLCAQILDHYIPT